uniref:Mitochondrial nucleoid factor 1 n=1 Tax=Chelonoidis abingdonii TaxID=106734 RepID=A0A8C0GU49_CHEAB
MAATRYRRFLKLCEEWLVEETKRGRDLGAFLRQRVAQAFREGESTQYPRLKDTSFTGVTVEECKLILATDSGKEMEEMKKGKWKKLREKFSIKNTEEDSKL